MTIPAFLALLASIPLPAWGFVGACVAAIGAYHGIKVKARIDGKALVAAAVVKGEADKTAAVTVQQIKSDAEKETAITVALINAQSDKTIAQLKAKADKHLALINAQGRTSSSVMAVA